VQQIVSLGIIVSAACLYILLERLLPYTKGQKLVRDGFWNDFVMYTLVQSFFLGQVIDRIVRALQGVHQFHLVTSWPLPVQLLFFFVTHDLYIYCFHRSQHKNKVLWRTHEAHHSVRDVDWLAGSRSHALEILINQTIEFAPIALLGAPPEIALWKGTLDAVWGMYIHANIDVRSGWLQYVINGPEMHRWHHKDDISDGVHNFGTKLAIWDWMFGTAHNPNAKPKGFGLLDVDFPESRDVRGLWANVWAMVKDFFLQQLFAFRAYPPGPYVAYGLSTEEADRRRAARLRAKSQDETIGISSPARQSTVTSSGAIPASDSSSEDVNVA
jgi:sterol desaturase/sphingolipid hydroxylase (fatty acid hydroxylase superfamily)